MNFSNCLIMFFIGLSLTACDSPQNVTSEVSSASQDLIVNEDIHKIRKSDVSSCTISDVNIDLCSKDNMDFYNKHLSDDVNFDKDKILVTSKFVDDIKSGSPITKTFFVVIDPKTYKVYPFNQTIGYFLNERLQEDPSSPAIINFNNKDSKVCLSGAPYFNDTENLNIENECYWFSEKKGQFLRDNESENKREAKSKGFQYAAFPYSSKKHVTCILYNTACDGLNLQSTSKLSKIYNFINEGDGDSAILKTNKDDLYIIISPYDHGAGASLRLMLVDSRELLHEENIYLSDGDITIDSNYVLHNKNLNMNRSLIKN